MKKYILLLIAGSSFLTGFSQALKYSNEFLSIGVGGRAMGMGGSVIASTDDVTSTYWNPAGLMGIQDNIQISAMHNEQFAGVTKHDYGSIGFKINDKSKAAISMIRLGVDGIPNTLFLMQDGQIKYDLIRSFSAVDYAFVGSYASETKIKGLTIGGNAKVIRRVVGSFGGAWGFGIDAAVNYKVANWRFAFVAKDVTSTFNAWSYTLTDADKNALLATGNAIPNGGLEITLPKFTFGAARKFEIANGKFSVLPELNFDFTTDGRRNVLLSSKYINLDPRAGVELGYNNFLFLRGGYSTLQRITDFSGKQTFNGMPSLGVGIKLQNIAIDYALGNAFNQGLLGMSNIISLRLNINKKG